VLTGPNGLAGEWGHNPLPWAEPGREPPLACYCGRRGCIEGWVSGTGLAADHARCTGEPLSAVQVHDRARSGDAHAQASLERHADRLARALASVINLLDPQVIVLGGGLSLMPHLYERVPALWQDWVFAAGSQALVRTQLVQSVHGDASGVRGAAWLWRQGAAATSA
jgi:fructokinase